jgi:hypothetical protein
VEVSFHQLCDDVNIVIARPRFRLHEVDQRNDIFVLEVLQHLDFPENSLSIDQVLESILNLAQWRDSPQYLLDSHLGFLDII